MGQRRRRPGRLAALVAAGALAAGCSGAPADAADRTYCRALEERSFESLTMLLPDASRAAVLEWGEGYRAALEEVAVEAPGEIAESWSWVLAELDLRLRAVATAGPGGLSHEQVEATVVPTLREEGWHAGRSRVALDARRRCGVALW